MVSGKMGIIDATSSAATGSWFSPPTLRTTVAGTALPPTKTAITALGLQIIRTSRSAVFSPITRRMIFIPPAVEPAIAPMGSRIMISAWEACDQLPKSSVA